MALREISCKGRNFRISYEILNPRNSSTIVFLHGWGSSKEAMMNPFSKSLRGYRHVYIDMPGFGRSPNESFMTTEDYADSVSCFLDSLGIVPDIVAGHSFGGKVATLLEPRCLVLIASSGIPVPKPFSVRFKIVLFKVLKRIGTGSLRRIFVADDAKGMNEGMYETFKHVVNEDFSDIFMRCRSKKTLLFWGREDSATPLWTAKRIEELIEGSVLSVYDGDHYFYAKHAPAISAEIEKQCASFTNRAQNTAKETE